MDIQAVLQPKHPGGRPVEYDPEIADTICKMVAVGTGIDVIGRMKKFPCTDTIYRWIERYPEFSESYARANLQKAHIYADQTVKIADTPEIGERRKVKADGTIEITTGDNVERSKLKVASRQWLCGKLNPAVYGDKLQVNQAITVTHEVSPSVAAYLDTLIPPSLPEPEPIDAEFEELHPEK